MKKILITAFLILGLASMSYAGPYNWGQTDTIPLLSYVFDTTSGHNHDGVNSRTVTLSSPYGSQNGISGVTGIANGIEFEGLTANDYEAKLMVADPTADTLWYLPVAAAASYSLMSSTLVTNAPDIANSITGGTNQLIFEGATADVHEAIIDAADPTADTIFRLPVMAAGTYGLFVSSLATNGLDIANSVTGTTNGLIFEGATADTNETTLTLVDPSADRTITLPNLSGTVALVGAVNTNIVATGSEMVTTTSADPGLGTASLTKIHTAITSDATGDAADEVSLAAGIAGQVKIITLAVDAETTGTKVLADFYGATVSYLLEDALDSLILVSDGTEWHVVLNNGGTAA